MSTKYAERACFIFVAEWESELWLATGWNSKSYTFTMALGLRLGTKLNVSHRCHCGEDVHFKIQRIDTWRLLVARSPMEWLAPLKEGQSMVWYATCVRYPRSIPHSMHKAGTLNRTANIITGADILSVFTWCTTNLQEIFKEWLVIGYPTWQCSQPGHSPIIYKCEYYRIK